MTDSVRVFIVENNRLLREGLMSMMNEVEDLVVDGASAGGTAAIEQIKKVQPDIALIGLDLPENEGILLTETLHQDRPNIKVIILGMPDLTDEVLACIEAGAVGYVLKEASFEYLVKTIHSAMRNESFISPRMASSLFSRIAELSTQQFSPESVKLTPREVEVVNEIAKGLTNKQIAEQLYIEVQTVKNHIHNILDKLQLHNRMEAVQYAREKNLLR